MSVTRIVRQAEIAVLTPHSMDQVKAGADQIKTGNPLIINFGSLNQEERLWAMHFLNGVVYAVDGQSLELSSRVFLFTPYNVMVSKE